jgi:hypothetical protein
MHLTEQQMREAAKTINEVDHLRECIRHRKKDLEVLQWPYILGSGFPAEKDFYVGQGVHQVRRVKVEFPVDLVRQIITQQIAGWERRIRQLGCEP